MINTIERQHAVLRLNQMYQYECKKDYLDMLYSISMQYAVKNMLFITLTESIHIEYKDMLIDYMCLPNNLTDKELIVYLQLLRS